MKILLNRLATLLFPLLFFSSCQEEGYTYVPEEQVALPPFPENAEAYFNIKLEIEDSIYEFNEKSNSLRNSYGGQVVGEQPCGDTTYLDFVLSYVDDETKKNELIKWLIKRESDIAYGSSIDLSQAQPGFYLDVWHSSISDTSNFYIESTLELVQPSDSYFFIDNYYGHKYPNDIWLEGRFRLYYQERSCNNGIHRDLIPVEGSFLSKFPICCYVN